MGFKDFIKSILYRLQELVLEMISFKFLLLVIVLYYVKYSAGNLSSAEQILTLILATTTTGVYKIIKDRDNKE